MPTIKRSMRGRAGPRARTWAVAVLLALASPTSSSSQSGPPNLRPFQPPGWPDAIVVSNRQGDNAGGRLLQASDRLYVDFAVINSGESPAASPFRIDLYVDGRLIRTFDVPAPLDPQAYRFREDYPIGSWGVGTHTLRIVADAGGSVAESDESDNAYTRTIIVGGGCVPLTATVSPRVGGTLVANREPNCGGATVSSFPARHEDVSGELALGGEPVMEARRARAFAALMAKTPSEERVRVIVGLRTPESFAASAGSFEQARTRSPLIARAQQALSVRMSGHDVSGVRRFRFIPYVAMEIGRAGLEALAADPEVVTIEEDLALEPQLAGSTSLIGAPWAWSQGFGGSGQAIAILDTGVDKQHPFLSGKVVSEACYSGAGGAALSFCPGGARESTAPGSGTSCSATGCGHGTEVAGIAAGRGRNVSGVAREADLIAIQVFSRCYPGSEDCTQTKDSDWIAGLERVLELSADFDIAAANMSFGGPRYEEDCDDDFPAAKAAMDNLRAAGIATVVASANDRSSRSIAFPACISSAVSVGATDGIGDGTTREGVSDFSNSSPQLDLLAPGRRINTSVPGGGFARSSGTSLAAPHVSGAWAVLKSKAPNAAVPELLSLLGRTGVSVTDSRNGLIRPRIQLDAALNATIPPMSYSSGTLLELTASPNPGYRFTLWRGCENTSGTRCVVAMEAARHVTAVFEPLGAAPDLVMTSLAAPGVASAGEDVALAATIANRGLAGAGSFRVGFYLSEDPEITIDDVWFAACTYEEGLPEGGSVDCRRSFPIPHRVFPGRYTLGAIVDDLDRVAERSETNNALAAASGPIEVLASRLSSRSFVPVIISAAGRRDSFFTSELILTNRGARAARLDYTYTAHAGGGSGRASDTLAPGRQKIARDAFSYLRRLGVPVRGSGNRIGTLAVEPVAVEGVGVLVRTTTLVPEGRAGLAYPGVRGRGFDETLYLCGLRQNEQDRSNVAVQHMGTAEDGPVTLRAWVRSGVDDSALFERVELEPGGFHQFNQVLSRHNYPHGYVEVDRVDGSAPFYAYGVINDNGNSDGSFVFPVTAGSLAGAARQTLPVIVETSEFSSELTVTNFSEQPKTIDFSFVADGLSTPDRTARFSLTVEAGRQRIIPDVIDTEMRRKGVEGVRASRGGLAGALFARAEAGDMSGIVIGARTGTPDGRGGQYGVFYPAVPDGAAFTASAWVDGLRQDEENRSNLALVNTGEVDDGESVFSLDIYDGDTGRLVRTVTTQPLPARRWRQINAILADHARGTTQGYVRVRKTSGNNPFLAYGVVNDGGAPGQRSGDGAYVPARE